MSTLDIEKFKRDAIAAIEANPPIPMNTTNDEQAPYGKNREAFGRIMDDALAKEEEALANSIGVNERGPFIKPTERAPMLSDEGIIEVHSTTDFPDTMFVRVRGCRDGFTMPKSALQFVHDLAEAMEAAIRAKITSGELRVVKKAHNVWNGINPAFQCSECGYASVPVIGIGQFCRCGAQIVK